MLEGFKELTVPEQLARQCLDMTETCWRQGVDSTEPLVVAYERLFGRPMPESLIVTAIVHEGRLCTAHIVPGGIVALWDPHRRWQLRRLSLAGRKVHDRVARVSSELTLLRTRSGDMPEGDIAPLAIVSGYRRTTFAGLGRAAGAWLRSALS